MYLEITAEVLLSQFGYHNNDNIIRQIQSRMDNTNGFDKFSKHLISLNDKLKRLNGYIAISNSDEVFKIKCDEMINKDIIEEFDTMVNNWANKYNVNLKKLENKNVYYILGKD
jgi:hypothetical protein